MNIFVKINNFYKSAQKLERKTPDGEAYELDNSDILHNYINKGFYIHYSDYPNLEGINVKSTYATPIGIYCYP